MTPSIETTPIQENSKESTPNNQSFDRKRVRITTEMTKNISFAWKDLSADQLNHYFEIEIYEEKLE